ncbi:REPLICATION PROTEIN A-RELATED, partial [Salix purpurea]
MFSSSQFDATSAFSGGGFMPSQSTQLTDSTPSPAKSRNSLGVVPVTVKQISQASQSGDEKSSFVINGVDVTNVTVVGMVFDKAEKSTDVSFLIDDGTGRIGCRRWVTENFDKLEMEAVQDGMYVRLVAFSVRPVTNFDEITFHFIDCIHSHLQNPKLQGGASTQPHMVESSMNTPVRNGQTITSNLMSKQFDSSSIGQEKGMHMDELCQQLKLPMEKI